LEKKNQLAAFQKQSGWISRQIAVISFVISILFLQGSQSNFSSPKKIIN
jgi:hypothetical protein